MVAATNWNILRSICLVFKLRESGNKTAKTVQHFTFALKIFLQYSHYFSASFSAICLPVVGTLYPNAFVLMCTSDNKVCSVCVHYQPLAPTLIFIISLLTFLAAREVPGKAVLSHLSTAQNLFWGSLMLVSRWAFLILRRLAFVLCKLNILSAFSYLSSTPHRFAHVL